MSTHFVSLRGFAVPYNQIEICDGRREFMTAATFDNPNARCRSTFLNFGEHDASPICSPLTIFSCSFGLGFAASIKLETWREISAYIKNSFQFCSVGFEKAEFVYERAPDGRLAAHMKRATIEHVTITDRPVYRGTGVWVAPASRIGDLPPRLAALERSWNLGRAQWGWVGQGYVGLMRHMATPAARGGASGI